MYFDIYSHMQVGKYGKVTGFKAYITEANSRKSVTFQLWRPSDLVGASYQLVVEYLFTVNGTGINEVCTESHEVQVSAYQILDHYLALEVLAFNYFCATW